GIALVLSAVFIPMAFFGGSTGVIYRQFSITIVAAMTLSVLVAIVFTPALCATMLKRIPKGHHGTKTGFFGWFNRMFDRSTHGYANSVARGLGRTKRLMLIYLLLVLIMGWLFTRIPTSFLPDEDQGILFVQVQAPTGSTTERTSESVREATRYLLEDEKDVVSSVFAVHGFSFGGRGQNSAMMFVQLRDWADRPDASQKIDALAKRANTYFATHMHDARVAAFAPPAVMELGNASGFDFQLMDQAGLGHEKLAAARDQFLAEAAKSPILVGTRLNGMLDQPQYQLNI